MVPIEDPILQFTVLVALAFAVQFTFDKLHLPTLVGLLAAGMVLGPGGLGVLPHGPVIEMLGLVGLLYIMFLAGLEIDLGVVRRHKAESASVGTMSFAAPMALALGVGLAYGLEWAGAILLGAALSSHTLVSYPMLESAGMISRRPVVATTGGTLLTDTTSLVVLVLIMQLAVDTEASVLIALMPLFLLVLLIAGALVVVPRIAGRLVANLEYSQAQSALFALFVLMTLSAAAELIGTEEILGAFLAGVCLNRAVRPRHTLSEHVQFVGRMLFIPFFFIHTGTLLELRVFVEQPDTWLLAGALFAAIVAGKGFSAIAAGRLNGYSRAERLLIFGVTIPQAAATLAVVLTGQAAGLFDATIVDAVIIVIFLTCSIGPLVARWAVKRMK